MLIYLSKLKELLAHRHRVTPQKTLTFSNVAVRTSNLSTDSFDDLFSRPLYFIRLIVSLCVTLDTDCHAITKHCISILFYFFWFNSPQWAMASSFMRFRVHTQRGTTVGRTPLDK